MTINSPFGARQRIAAGPGALLGLIRSNRAWTRAQLVRESGLARSTTGERLDALVEAGFVLRRSEPVSTGGRPAESFVFNADGGYLLLADIGGSHSRIGLSGIDGRFVQVVDADLDIGDGPEKVLGYVRDQFIALCKKQSIAHDRVRGIGIGVPGPVDSLKGRLVRPRTMPGWDDTIVSDFFTDTFQDVPVLVDKDANIMALGEYRTSWKDAETMLCVKAGMGIGCGIIADGQVLRGANGAAADIGHIPKDSSVQCRCGQYGCVDAVAGGRAIAEKLRAAGRVASSSRDIVELVKAGDSLAASLVRQSGREIGTVLISAIAIINPSLIIIGGNLGESPEPLLAGIREIVYSDSHPLATQDLQILPSKIGPEAGLTGAAHMVLDAILSPDAVDRAIAAGHHWRHSTRGSR